MEIVPTDYPEFFPCPTWQYGQGQASFTQRVPFDSGWVRQRRKFDDTYLSIDLSFIMSTAVYSRWSDWVNANGYDWFVIPLDRFEGEKKDFTIRFKSILNMAYDAYDRVIVTVSAEQYEGKPNPNKIYNPEGPPAPGEYECSALDAALVEEGLNRIYDLAPDDSAFPWPFAAVNDGNGGPTQMSAWENYVTGSLFIADWQPAGYVYKANITAWPWYEDAQKFVQCGYSGAITQVVNVENNISINGFGIPTDDWVGSSGYSLNMVFTGFNGGGAATHELCGNNKARWALYDGGGTFIDVFQTQSYILIDPFGADGNHRITMNAGQGDGSSSSFFDIGSIEGHWVNCTVSVDEYVDFVPDGPGTVDALLHAKITVTVTHRDGSSFSGTVDGYTLIKTGGVIGSAVIAPNSRLQDAPRVFYGGDGRQITIAALAYGNSPQPDHLKISQQFVRNFTS